MCCQNCRLFKPTMLPPERTRDQACIHSSLMERSHLVVLPSRGTHLQWCMPAGVFTGPCLSSCFCEDFAYILPGALQFRRFQSMDDDRPRKRGGLCSRKWFWGHHRLRRYWRIRVSKPNDGEFAQREVACPYHGNCRTLIGSSSQKRAAYGQRCRSGAVS